ncbi:hypothetical protein [Actinomyces wuliandei]|uniref:hypothetical protein n=1 Tax=Actinomyces wuliandei TaxID=2057743 RepID=UPI001FA94466|nr:hypothetical protein [Actinomyces wuliandei]
MPSATCSCVCYVLHNVPTGLPSAWVGTGAVASSRQAGLLDWGGWSGPLLVVVLLLLLLLALGWALYARAVRVDRLHRQVLGARATLEAQILHRAEAAADLASTGVLDPASCVLLAQAARDALDAEGPIVSDGLDPVPRLDSAYGQAGPAATQHGPSAPVPGARSTRSRSRPQLESDLSRVIRTVVDVQAREDLSGSQRGSQALARLDRACYRMVLARRFHNTHVKQARALRERPVVRVLHLAGHAPVPQTFEADDETAPAGHADSGSQQPRPPQEEQEDGS